MRKRLILPVTALLLSLALTATADDKQVVTVDNQQVNKTVSQLTFNDSQVVLHFTDQTTETADMSDVVIVFTIVDAMKELSTEGKDVPQLYFDLSGRQLKKAPAKGSYIIKKGKKIVKLVK